MCDISKSFRYNLVSTSARGWRLNRHQIQLRVQEDDMGLNPDILKGFITTRLMFGKRLENKDSRNWAHPKIVSTSRILTWIWVFGSWSWKKEMNNELTKLQNWLRIGHNYFGTSLKKLKFTISFLWNFKSWIFDSLSVKTLRRGK